MADNSKEQSGVREEDVTIKASTEVSSDLAKDLSAAKNAGKTKDYTKEKHDEKAYPNKFTQVTYWVMRVVAFLMLFLTLFPATNPAYVTKLIPQNTSILAIVSSYTRLTQNCTRAFNKGYITEASFKTLYTGSWVYIIALVLIVAGVIVLSLGNSKFKRLGAAVTLGGGALSIVSLLMMKSVVDGFNNTANLSEKSANWIEKNVGAALPSGWYMLLGFAIALIVLQLIAFAMLLKMPCATVFEMEPKFQLFLLILPFAFLALVFSYLPLWGWRYAFFDYESGDGELTKDMFVGLKWFKFLFQNEATKANLANVMKNTLGLSFIGISTSWLPMVFAIFLSEIHNSHFKRIVQIFTTIPNFISWVLVYSIAFILFSADGLINSLMGTSTMFLMSTSHLWLKMWAWGTWKGLGWSAIIYISAISGIDQQLYEAATVDGAGRFQKMWHVTLPGLLPTFIVLLVMSIAGILSNGMDQYLVFSNASTIDKLNVLDLYVYKLVFDGNGLIPLSTVIGMAKSIISIILLFIANTASKAIRGSGII